MTKVKEFFFFLFRFCSMWTGLNSSRAQLPNIGFLPPASEGWGKVLFSVCLSVHISEGTPSQVWPGGLPHPRSGWGGGTQSQVWSGGNPRSGQGGTHPRSGQWYPPMTRSGWGTPQDLGWGTPWTWDWVPPRPGTGYPPSSIARRTWYVVGNMPLAFMQEDFLVAVVSQCHRYIYSCVLSVPVYSAHIQSSTECQWMTMMASI